MGTSITQEPYNIRLVQFLDDHKPGIFQEWHDSFKTDEMDFSNEQMKENGFLMYSVLRTAISGLESQSTLTDLAHKVAAERLEANINIGNFVYNINLGRSIIIKYAMQSEIPLKYLYTFINNINKYFDQFCFDTVTEYTNLKDQELEEKTLYISENHKDKLAILGQMSSSFVHEFRNPLTSVIGFNKLLRKEHPNVKYLDIIENELQQLNFRITQFLHTSKAEFNDLNIIIEEISIIQLFNDIQQLTYPSIVDNDVQVVTDIQPSLIVTANKDEIKQVLLNLFVNSIDALKDSAKPRYLKVSCNVEAGHLVVRISNNGPMIAPEHIKTIFEPFFTTKELGTGIGLFVCKKIIEKNAGSIQCDSNETATTFSINLPSLHS
ncbi:HAMP domain-containing sensor histidine kinase [Bacillus sp. CECT 9360]|uniref:sensor histidine kinase n=1 Tax=Bacillus sp. CECT 9360 TaxID=2845821 RepID=UPI001E3CF838|nr:HAMP domain-containing sensor histidine kinase [Bacillus sp. CECT 9360]CAH0346737.1 Adaptive-response sensory-kinase SasA [Bacillus sp. CECT 9360]